MRGPVSHEAGANDPAVVAMPSAPSSLAPPPAAAATSRLRRATLRGWLWLLTPGWRHQSAAAKLRGWARHIEWSEGGPRHQAKLLWRAVTLPWQAWRAADAVVARAGTEVQRRSGTPLSTQRRQIATMILRHGMHPGMYTGYSLYRPERWARAGGYVHSLEYFRVVRWYNAQHEDSDAPALIDKRRYVTWSQAHGIPTVPTLLEFERGELRADLLPSDLDRAAAALPHDDLFSKPTEGTGGHGTERWTFRLRDGVPVWHARDGVARTGVELLAELARLSSTLPGKHGRSAHRIMLQPCLRNHRSLGELTTSALSTVRIVTLREPDGRARAVAAGFRMATGDEPADNFSNGGIVAPVDMTTGRLVHAIRLDAFKMVEDVTHHPDTGAAIAGFTLPWWREAVDLAERGLAAAHRLPSIGWDIALTDDGPIAVEANPASHPGIAQRASGTPLVDTPIPHVILAHVHRHVGLD